MIEIIGLIVSIVGFFVAIALAIYPPNVVGRRAVHVVYILSLVVTSGFLAYLTLSSDAEVAKLRALSVEKDKLSIQAKSVASSLGSNTSDGCRGIVMTVFAFAEKWKTTIPETFEVAKGLLRRSVESEKPSYLEATAQQRDCMRDADAMRQLLRGLAAQ